LTSSLKARPTAVTQPTHRQYQLYRRLERLTREASVYSKSEPRLGAQRPPSTPPRVAREIASKQTNIRLSQDTERMLRATRTNCAAKASNTAGLAVSIPWAMCARGARQAAMKPPRMRPTESAAVTTSELSLSCSTKLPINNPSITTTESEKNAPDSHELRLIRWPKNKKSSRNGLFLLLSDRTLN